MRTSDPMFRALLVILLLPLVLEGAQKKATPAPSKSAPKPSAKPSATAPKAKSPSTTNSTRKRTATRRRSPRRDSVARAQAQPARERYSQIQAALAKAGYFHGPADGNWDKNSVAALTQFQTAHRLEPTGRIDALSLIKLGLGPKYSETAEARRPTPNPQ